jgi:hypothetical protein
VMSVNHWPAGSAVGVLHFGSGGASPAGAGTSLAGDEEELHAASRARPAIAERLKRFTCAA